ncbi:MAG: hypothetical protein KC484_00730 [Colwelliaceae bacterium]|nr:hypothetical protein [Colwelliaceae bacterium]
MNVVKCVILKLLLLLPITTVAGKSGGVDLSEIISKEEFLSYKDVGEFIDQAPKVTITVKPEQKDIKEYGKGVVKSLTGSDCNRDGKMDDNATCNAAYYKLWIKYSR